MYPIARWPHEDRARIVGVLTDIDDTLTTDGKATPEALHALARLKASGLAVIAITGRPVGWSMPFAERWPVDAIVPENGAVALVQVPGEPLRKLYQQDETTRIANFRRMQQVAVRVVREVTGAQLAEDSVGRETDIAVDHSEFHRLDEAGIRRVVRIMEAEGMTATVSSIHINGWYGAHNKLEGARWIVRELFGRDLDAELDRWVYVGDSTNDQLMFEAFPNSVGVANIRAFEKQLTHKPRYITDAERGAGFAEMTHKLMGAR